VTAPEDLSVGYKGGSPLTLRQATLTLECWWVIEVSNGLARDSDCWWKVAGIASANLMLQLQLSWRNKYNIYSSTCVKHSVRYSDLRQWFSKTVPTHPHFGRTIETSLLKSWKSSNTTDK